MSDVAIRAEHIGKKYILQHQRARGHRNYTALRDVLAEKLKAPFRALRGVSSPAAPTQEEFWALKDLSFEIRHGEAVGIIGRNGAGKSTLLKLLSRITPPSRGRIELYGRVASLLEVGTGFHPELTGRENIYLNGAILGMSRSEIRRKFDEIVAFAEVERFLDTPVKRYSSGMYVRLAFAVAAHLEPEILIVDEVLAVGDHDFQKKCLGKMDDVAKTGRTVLFVSHQMATIERLTQRCLVLNSGNVVFDGKTSQAVEKYLELGASRNYAWNPGIQNDRTEPYFTRVFLVNPDGTPCTQPTTASQFGVELEFCLPDNVRGVKLSLDIISDRDYTLFATTPIDCGHALPTRQGLYRTRVVFPRGIFMAKQFHVKVSLYSGNHLYDCASPAFSFFVEEVASLANTVSTSRMGDLQVYCEWSSITQV